MNETIPNTSSLSLNVNVPIQLDAVCSTQGEFVPRWFRFEDDEHVIRTIKISRVISRKEIGYVGMKSLQFICGSLDYGERERLFELRYNISGHKWTLYQMLS